MITDVNQQQFCPECGGKLKHDQDTGSSYCTSCGEKYFVKKKWLKSNRFGKSKKRDIYTLMPLKSDIGWKPSKMVTEIRLHQKKRDEKEPGDRFSKRNKSDKKPSRRVRDNYE